MKRLILVAATLLAAACSSTPRRCEQVCAKMLDTCGWQAWSSVEQCKQGCQDELYRRPDADEVLACYDAAVDPLERQAAEEEVTRALDAGLFRDQVDAGTFSFVAAVEARVESSRCDLFATIRCRIGEAAARPNLPLADD